MPDTDRARLWALVNATHGDPLAPFAMQGLKSHHFSVDGSAALAYRTRLGFAVVSGDPIGDESQFPSLVGDFAALCRDRSWRLAVLGCSHRHLGLWSHVVTGRHLRAIPIGRDVVIDVPAFQTAGHEFRNVRQAVQRTHNAGITTEIVAEDALSDGLRRELAEVVRSSRKGARHERGFSMILDGTLTGRYPGILLILARDKDGCVQGFQRYATSGSGSDITLDLPWRRRNVPNGVDERLTVDMIAAMREAGAQRLSLAFAAFPEIFEDPEHSRLGRLFYLLIHLGDRLIALESLYRYLRKFHALGERRYVVLTPTQTVPLLAALLWLEFAPRRRRFTWPVRRSR